MTTPKSYSPAAKALGDFLIGHEKRIKPFAIAAAEEFRDAAIGALKGWEETHPEATARIERGRQGLDVTIYMPSVLGRISLNEGMFPPGASPRAIDRAYPGLYSEASALRAISNKVASLLEDDGRERLFEIMMQAAQDNPGDLMRSAPPRTRIAQAIGDQGWNATSMGYLSNCFLHRIKRFDAFADYLVKRVREGGQPVEIAEGASAHAKMISAQAAASMREDVYTSIAKDFITREGEMSNFADYLEEVAREENEQAAAYSAEMEGP